MTKPAPLYAVLWDYGQLIEALDARRVELGLSHDEWNERADLPDGFTSKACGPGQTAKFGHLSLFKAVRQLGLRIVFEVDEKATKTILDGRAPRDNRAVRSKNYSRSAARRHRQRVHRELATMGANALNAKLTPEQRAANGRKGALIRWSDVKAAASQAPEFAASRAAESSVGRSVDLPAVPARTAQRRRAAL